MDSVSPLFSVICEKAARVAGVTQNRPSVLNALNRQSLDELWSTFAAIRLDNEIRVVILTGSGDRAFAAGADIKELAVLTPTEALDLSKLVHALMDAIETLGKPVVAAVNGYALGGGCELAMACTVRIASEGAKFGQPEVTLDLIPGYGGSQRLPRLVGKGHAMKIVLSGKAIDAQEAYRIGLVNEVVPATDLTPRSHAVLTSMTANAPLALRFAIEAKSHGLESSQFNSCEIEATLFGLCASTQDRTEGTRAFLAKRKPEFHGH